MANSGGIGQLLIELGVNTAYMKEGFEQATHMTKKFGREVESTFRELGKSTSELAAAFGVLGPAGAELAGAFNVAGQAAGKMIRDIAGSDKVFGVFKAGAAGVVAGLTSIAIAAIAMTTHSAENIKKMGEQAEMAGMNVTEFSRYAYAARLSGLSSEAFSTSMSRLTSKMEQAGNGAGRALGYFKLAGMSQEDLKNHTYSTGEALEKLADWFHKTEDGATKNDAAMALGGRGMKRMIDMLNEGGEAIRNRAAEADALNLTISKGQEETAKKFIQSTMAIQGFAEGAVLALESKLAPALKVVADAIVQDLKSPDSQLKSFTTGIAELTKAFLLLGTAIAETMGAFGSWVQHQGAKFSIENDAGIAAAKAQEDAIKAAGEKNVPGEGFFARRARIEKAGAQAYDRVMADATNAMKAEQARVDKQDKERESHFAKMVLAITASTDATPTEGGKDKGKSPSPFQATKQEPSEADKYIASIRRQGEELAKVAVNANEAAEKVLLYNAASKAGAEVESKIDFLKAKGAALAARKQEMDDAEAAGDTITKSKKDELDREIAMNNAQIGKLRKFKDERIKIAVEGAVEEAARAEAKQTGAKQNDIDQQIADAKTYAAALAQGGEAVIKAQADKALRKDDEALAQLVKDTTEYARQNPTMTANIARNSVIVAEATMNNQLLHKSQQAFLDINLATKIDQETKKFEMDTRFIRENADALKLSVEQRNALKAQQAGEAYKQAHPEEGDAGAARAAAQSKEKSDAEVFASTKTKENELDALHTYELQKKVLDDIIADKNASDGLHKLAELQEIEDMQKMRQSLDDQFARSNDISTVMLAWADKLAAELPKLSNDLANDMIKAVDQFNSALINAIGTGKINFHSLLTSIAKDFASTALKGTEGLIASLATGQGKGGQGKGGQGKGAGGIFASLFGGKSGGAGERGTAANPMITQDVSGENPLSSDDMKAASLGDTGGDTSGDTSGDGGGAAGGLSGIFSGLFGKLSGMLGGIFGQLSSVFGKIFGGFLASGGDVTPGKAYVVGEHHPEFFVPRASGHVAPTMRTADAPKTYVSNVHFHGVTDADSFRRSQAQVMQGVGFGMSAALGRK